MNKVKVNKGMRLSFGKVSDKIRPPYLFGKWAGTWR